jgi:hypothetical protein
MTQTTADPIHLSTFFDYRRTEINLVSDLQRLQAISTKLAMDPAIVDLIEQALARNKGHRFSIAVVGEFKRGKSTFINALLGKDILPSDILPCSATLNRVVYDLEPAVEIVYKAGQDGLAQVERHPNQSRWPPQFRRRSSIIPSLIAKITLKSSIRLA